MHRARVRHDYHKARVGILKQYVTALEGLVKTQVQAGRIDSAKDVKVEKEKIAFMLADAESKSPAPAPAARAKQLSKALRKGLILWYGFDTDVKKQIVDKSGLNNNSTIPEGVTWMPNSKVGGGLSIHTGTIYTAKKVGISGNKPRTIAFWAKPITANDGCIALMGPPPAVENHQKNIGRYFGVMISKGEWYLWECGEHFDWRTGAAARLGKWSHQTVTYDGAVARWYVDGSEVGNGYEVKLDTLDSPLQIGTFAGEIEIDELMVWNRALSDVEAKQLSKEN